MRYGASGRMLGALLLAAVAGLALAIFALRRGEELQPVLVDERAGALHGVRFGDSEREVVARLGQDTHDHDGFFPEGADYTGPPVIRSPAADRGSRIRPSVLHYGETAYIVSRTSGVFAMATLETGARTRADVGVGDELELVRTRYDRVECGKTVAGEPLFGGEPPTYSWCRARVGAVRLFFGGDPIESITLTSDVR